MAAAAEPGRRSWAVRFGGLLEAVNGTDIDPSGRTDLLKLLDEAKRDGKLAGGEATDFDDGDETTNWPHRLDCDCTGLSVVDGDSGEPLATVPLHQIASVGFVREPPENILALKVGDVVEGAPDLFDLVLVFAPSEAVAEQVCHHFVQCFQLLYREAISAMEQCQLEGEEGEDGGEGGHHGHPPEMVEEEEQNLAKKFLPASSAASATSLDSPTSSTQQNRHHRRMQVGTSLGTSPLAAAHNLAPFLGGGGGAHSSVSTASSGSTRQAVELVNEYLTMLSACLSHDELNKFAILMRRWRAREMPILEFAQKLYELYGPERRHLLARMRSLLRGDPADLEALGDFLRANGVVENAAAASSQSSPPLTAEMSLGGSSQEGPQTASCPPSASSSFHIHSPPNAVAAHQHSHSSS